MDSNKTFKLTYSAKEQAEIKAIRKKYAPSDDIDKMERLRRLDAAVTRKATAVSLVFGIIGALVMGVGMSLTMTELSKSFELAMPVGIAVGVVGIALVCAAYPLYNRTLTKERKKIAPEILKLTDELIK